MKTEKFDGKKALIMGLGLNGGGVESARYLASLGAKVTVTDLRDEKTLAASIEKLQSLQIRFVLGSHNIEDFRKADIVIKNPGVKPDSPFLKEAKRVETDISLFLAGCPARLVAITGSKGKSTTAAALHHVLKESRAKGEMKGEAFLGGNIAISPLGFLSGLKENDDVVLELSSWQLGDLRGRNILKPRAAIITSIMKDHLDRYSSMEEYISDKRLIYQNQDEKDIIVASNDDWGKSFHRESRGRPLVYSGEPLDKGIAGGWIDSKGSGIARLWGTPFEKSNHINYAAGQNNGCIVEIVPARLLIPGYHQKLNLLAAALALLDLGLEGGFIRDSLGRFPGIEHRLEYFHESRGIRFYNDSAATIPEAAAAAVAAFPAPPLLVCGGTDKELDFTPLVKAAAKAREIILIAGTGSEKLKKLLDEGGVKYHGPFDSLEAVIKAIRETAIPGDNAVLSPGCTSFGMFLNEFDRGTKWKEAIRNI